MDIDQINVHVLPPQARFLVAIIGLPETINLLRAKGGLQVRIPTGQRDAESYELHGILSATAIKQLCASQYAGQRLTLPKLDKILNQIRNIDIRSQRGQTTKAQLATKYNLSARHVQRLWNDDMEKLNLDLFDDSA